jgi:hypothetical protein
MPATREINSDRQTVMPRFTDGRTFGPMELNSVTDALTRMIVELESRLAVVESRLEDVERR